MLVLWAMLAEMFDAYKGINWASEINSIEEGCSLLPGVIYLRSGRNVLFIDSDYQKHHFRLLGRKSNFSIIKYGIIQDTQHLTFLSEAGVIWNPNDHTYINEIVSAGVNLNNLFIKNDFPKPISWEDNLRSYTALLSARGVDEIRSSLGDRETNLFPLDLLTAYNGNDASAFWTY